MTKYQGMASKTNEAISFAAYKLAEGTQLKLGEHSSAQWASGPSSLALLQHFPPALQAHTVVHISKRLRKHEHPGRTGMDVRALLLAYILSACTYTLLV